MPLSVVSEPVSYLYSVQEQVHVLYKGNRVLKRLCSINVLFQRPIINASSNYFPNEVSSQIQGEMAVYDDHEAWSTS